MPFSVSSMLATCMYQIWILSSAEVARAGWLVAYLHAIPFMLKARLPYGPMRVRTKVIASLSLPADLRGGVVGAVLIIL